MDFNSDYERSVFSTAYNEGKENERKRILKLIDDFIEHYQELEWLDEKSALEELKEKCRKTK